VGLGQGGRGEPSGRPKNRRQQRTGRGGERWPKGATGKGSECSRGQKGNSRCAWAVGFRISEHERWGPLERRSGPGHRRNAFQKVKSRREGVATSFFVNDLGEAEFRNPLAFPPSHHSTRQLSHFTLKVWTTSIGNLLKQVRGIISTFSADRIMSIGGQASARKGVLKLTILPYKKKPTTSQRADTYRRGLQ